MQKVLDIPLQCLPKAKFCSTEAEKFNCVARKKIFPQKFLKITEKVIFMMSVWSLEDSINLVTQHISPKNHSKIVFPSIWRNEKQKNYSPTSPRGSLLPDDSCQPPSNIAQPSNMEKNFSRWMLPEKAAEEHATGSEAIFSFFSCFGCLIYAKYSIWTWHLLLRCIFSIFSFFSCFKVAKILTGLYLNEPGSFQWFLHH